MIAIINKGPVGKSRDRRKYNVQINNKLITTFQHNRSDGLAKCLELAAQAVRQQEKAVQSQDAKDIDKLLKTIIVRP